MVIQKLLSTTKNDQAKWIQLSYVALGLLAVGALSFYSYRYYIVSRESEAQRVFSHAYETFVAAQNEGTPTSWQAAENTLLTSYEKNKSSSVAPIFKAFQADTLLAQGKNNEAIAAMEVACNGFSTSSSLYPYFAVKYALMRIDHGNDAVRAEGLKSLIKLADKSNKNRDNALYYLGSYYAAHGDEQNARASWNELVSIQTGAQDTWSTYAVMAQTKVR